MATAVIIIVIVIICVLAVKGYMKKLSKGCCGTGGDDIERISPIDEDVSHYPYITELSVGGMTCKNCAMRIENAFNKNDGYYATVDFKTAHAVIRTKSEASQSEIRRIIYQLGYTISQ